LTVPSKRRLEIGEEADESEDVKRRRKILEDSRDLDADSVGSESDEDDEEETGSGKKKGKAVADEDEEEEDDDDEDDSDEDSDDSDDPDDLQAELDKIRRERAEARAKEEAEKAAVDQEQREFDIARGNPLLNPQDFNVKRRWDDDVVFKNQARGTEERGKQREFVNDLLRSDFHKRFMVS
jgi:protein CWC15